MTASVIPFRLRRDRLTLRRARDAETGEACFVLFWTPAEEPDARISVWEGANYGDALAAIGGWAVDCKPEPEVVEESEGGRA